MKIIRQKQTDAKELYQEYLNYQNGDISALERLFVITNDNPKRLIEKYYAPLDEGECDKVEADDIFKYDDVNKDNTLNLDNVLDAEFIKAEIHDEDERENNYGRIKFRFTCLSNMEYKAKWEYSKASVNTGNSNNAGTNCGYKKFHEGEYDISEIHEMMIEIIIKIFQKKLIVNETPIVDAETLLKNIKHHLTKEMGKASDTVYKNIPEFRYEIDCDGEEKSYSYFDQVNERDWIYSQGEVDRLLIYSDYLKWLYNNDIHKLFKANSEEVHIIIDSI